jgi:hypothetical protein
MFTSFLGFKLYTLTCLSRVRGRFVSFSKLERTGRCYLFLTYDFLSIHHCWAMERMLLTIQ